MSTNFTFSLCTYFALFFIAILTLSCQSKESDTSEAKVGIVVPDLIDRNPKIQMGKEWEYVQNFYVEQREAIKKNPRDYETLLNLAQLYVKEARVTGEHGHYYPAALHVTSQILNQSPDDRDIVFRTLTTQAGVQLSLHDFSGALETGKKAVKINPTNAQIYGVLVDAYVELGEYEKAVSMADRMISIKPDLRSYSRVSYLREIHGDVDGAVEAMQLAVSAGFPGYEETAWSMLTLGNLYETYNKSEKAEAIYHAILKDRPGYPFAIAAIANIQMKNKDYEQAEASLREAIDIIPEVGYYTQLAEILKIQNRTEEFNQIMDEVFLMLEDDVDAGHHMNLEYADIYLELLDKPERALEYVNIEYKKRPKNIDVNRLLAKIYLEQEAIDRASEHLIAASITDSGHPELQELKKQL